MYNRRCSRPILATGYGKIGGQSKQKGKVNQVKAKSKLLALLLALVMVFGMALPAFAADDAATPSAEPTMTEAPASSAEPEESGSCAAAADLTA